MCTLSVSDGEQKKSKKGRMYITLFLFRDIEAIKLVENDAQKKGKESEANVKRKWKKGKRGKKKKTKKTENKNNNVTV
ncbi:hypothetical protein POVCU2_0099200 [Plasmodium ovale curtisi]|uniref:Uncharacterized protein n=1 Tax=Plasmodium ovale curtisi TaxID=864141 RepID=A0A1A8WTL1_PLAOA|nr:hypothetical protein POVCU2_0099200 [Plasmodium ovale curtisi]SBS96295.1 hypothetical protein POVCU1_031910 [Plasmodium ovale curtisi]